MDFMNEMKNVLNDTKTLTTNGAVAYKTSGKHLLDFNFAISSYRRSSVKTIEDDFARVFYEDKMIAIKYLFYLADVRGGLGERRTFNICMKWLVENHEKIAKQLLPLIPEYTRWDNLLALYNTNLSQEILQLFKVQLNEDCKNLLNEKPISLCAKWVPSLQSKRNKTRKFALDLISELGIEKKQYRKMLSSLREYLDITEKKMSNKQWTDINYEHVPSKANLLYNSAFLKNDEERRRAYLASLSKGKAKINASTLQPHEITYKYRNSRQVDETLEALWKALPDLSIENTLVVRDGSGSMTWTTIGNNGATPLDVATALAIYMSEHNSGIWKDKYITFSQNPKIVDLSNCTTLREKVQCSLRETDYTNTDIYKTMKLILNTAVKNNATQEDMPKTIVICSDMQFDGRGHHFNKTLFDLIGKEFEHNGYKLPRICFWNIAGSDNKTIPMQQNDLGLILCSSFSIQILKMFMSGETDPYKILLEQLNSERYTPVEEAVKEYLK